MNRKVGRAVLCAPTLATTLSFSAKDGAHGVTRPTSANRHDFEVTRDKNVVWNWNAQSFLKSLTSLRVLDE